MNLDEKKAIVDKAIALWQAKEEEKALKQYQEEEEMLNNLMYYSQMAKDLVELAEYCKEANKRFTKTKSLSQHIPYVCPSNRGDFGFIAEQGYIIGVGWRTSLYTFIFTGNKVYRKDNASSRIDDLRDTAILKEFIKNLPLLKTKFNSWFETFYKE